MYPASSLTAMAVGAVGRGPAVAALRQARGWAVRGMAQFASGFSMPMPKRLDEIMPVSVLEETEASEIARLWNDVRPAFLTCGWASLPL